MYAAQTLKNFKSFISPQMNANKNGNNLTVILTEAQRSGRTLCIITIDGLKILHYRS
jgi:hypothetical protein